MTKQETIQVLKSIEDRAVDFPYMTACDWVAISAAKRHLENSLETKEVDLEKELIKWHKQHFKKDGTFIGKSGFYLTNNSQMDFAKHFFELGIQVSNKAQKGE